MENNENENGGEQPKARVKGWDIGALADELKRQKETKKDFVVDTRTLVSYNKDGKLHLDVAEVGDFGLTDYAHRQLADKTQIPQKYYDKMRDKGKIDLLSQNVNEWLPERDKRMVRILDDRIRAILSDRYKVIDNFDILYLAMEEFVKSRVEIQRADLTETNLYIKAIQPHTVDEIKDGDRVVRGIVIRNSEVGAGAFRVEPFLFRLVCQNGMIGERTINKVHLGRKREVGEIFSIETRHLEDKALWSGIKDVITNTFDDIYFHDWVAKLREAANTEVVKPVEAIGLVVSEYKLPDDFKNNLLRHFSGEKNVWELANSVTRSAQDVESYDRQIELETIGNDIATNPQFIKKVVEL